ncbi:uncharacterized protein V6R79_024824 [Siganus canaliculatus]
MESRDKDGTLPCYCVCVPRTRNRYSWFQGLFCSQASSQLKCLSVLFNDTSPLQTITHGGTENKRETNKLAVDPSRFQQAHNNCWKKENHLDQVDLSNESYSKTRVVSICNEAIDIPVISVEMSMISINKYKIWISDSVCDECCCM